MQKLIIYEGNDNQMELKCGKCGNSFNNEDKVCLDRINTIIHQSCSLGFNYKDTGTYQEIIDKYDFFKNLR